MAVLDDANPEPSQKREISRAVPNDSNRKLLQTANCPDKEQTGKKMETAALNIISNSSKPS